MNFRYINNWIAQLVEPLPAGWDSLPVPQDRLTQLMSLQPGEEFRLTVTQSQDPLSQSRFEVLSLTKNSSGALVLGRGKEGTDDQVWPVGSVVFAGVTAGMLQSIGDSISGAATASGSMLALNSETARTWLCELDTNATIDLALADVGRRLDVLLIQDDAGDHAVTWPAGVLWSGSNVLGPDAGQVTKAELLSLGNGRWLGSTLVYEAGAVVQLPPRYAAVWASEVGVSKVNVGLFDGAGALISSTSFEEDAWSSGGDIGLAITDDASYVALNIYTRSSAGDTFIFKTSDWTWINANAPIATMGPCRVPFVIQGDALYGVSAHGSFPGFTCYRVMLATGVRTDLFEVPGEVQSISAKTGEVTCTSHNALGYSGTPRPCAWTFDLSTSQLSASQFPLPAGAELNISTPSPDGSGGAYSSDGKLFGLFTKLYYPGTGESRTSIIIYNAKTRAIQIDVEVPGAPQAWWFNPVWSPDGNWFGVLLNSGGLSAVLQLDTQALTVAPVPPGGVAGTNSSSILTNTGEMIFDMYPFKAVKGLVPVTPMLNVPDGGHLLLASN